MSRPTLGLKFNRGEIDMAQKSVVEAAMVETAEVRPPDFERALRVIRHDINPSIEIMAETRGDVSAAWKIIADECAIEKRAARTVMMLMNASEEKRDDYLRSFYGLLRAANIAISADLVDRMGGAEPPTMPIAERSNIRPISTFN